MKKYLVFLSAVFCLIVLCWGVAAQAGTCPNYFSVALSVGDEDGVNSQPLLGADLRGLTAVADMQRFLNTQGLTTAIPESSFGKFYSGATLTALTAWQDKQNPKITETDNSGKRYFGPASLVAANKIKCGTNDTVLPTVAFTYPTAAATYATTADQTFLSVTARDNVGLSSLGWTSNRKYNGLTQSRAVNYPPNTGSGLGLAQIWNGPGEAVKLLPGLNIITVTATDAAGNQRTTVLNITKNTSMPVNGVCGSAGGVAVASAPTTVASLCSAGIPTEILFSSLGNYYWWKCNGTGTGHLTPTCRAKKLPSTPDHTPPTVEITYPTTNGSYPSHLPSLVLKGTASSPLGISAVKWFWGSNPSFEFDAVGTNNWSASIPLEIGTNVIRVRAIDKAGRDSYDNITINYSSDNNIACFDLPRNLYQNDGTVNGTDQKSNDVRSLQQYLISHGFLATKYLEGGFGPSTVSALAAWQNSHRVTGDIDSRGRVYWGPKSQAGAKQGCAPVGSPIISSFTVDRTSVAAGIQVVFSWSVSNSDSCKITYSTGEDEAIIPFSIKTYRVVPPAGKTTTYTLECQKGNLKTSATPIAITVAPAISGEVPLDLIVRPAFSNRTGNRVPNGMGLTVSSGFRATKAVQNVKVQWYIDGTPIQKKVGIVASVPAATSPTDWQKGTMTNGLTDIYLPWDTLKIFDLNAPHTLKMVIDPDNTIAEANEGNNAATLTYSVDSAPVSRSGLNLMGNILQALREILGGLR